MQECLDPSARGNVRLKKGAVLKKGDAFFSLLGSEPLW